jgi:hypothetical protein
MGDPVSVDDARDLVLAYEDSDDERPWHYEWAVRVLREAQRADEAEAEASLLRQAVRPSERARLAEGVLERLLSCEWTLEDREGRWYWDPTTLNPRHNADALTQAEAALIERILG